MTISEITSETKTVQVSAFLQPDGDSVEQTYTCQIDSEGQIASATKPVYSISTLYFGSHRSDDGTEYATFEEAYSDFEAILVEDEDYNTEEHGESTEEEIRAAIDSTGEFEQKVGVRTVSCTDWPVYLVITKTDTVVELVDSPKFQRDDEGETDFLEAVLLEADGNFSLGVQITDEDGNLDSWCSLDGDKLGYGMTWTLLKRIPKEVYAQIEEGWACGNAFISVAG